MRKAGLERDFTGWQRTLDKEAACTLDAASNHVFMDRYTDGTLEERAQVRRTDARYPRQAKE